MGDTHLNFCQINVQLIKPFLSYAIMYIYIYIYIYMYSTLVIMNSRKLPLLNHCDHHSLLPSLHLSALMRLNEEPPLSSSVTTTRGSSRAIESIRNGSERWRRGGLTTNLRHHILHRVRCSRNLFSDFLYFSKTSKSSDKSRRIDYNTQRVNKSQ